MSNPIPPFQRVSACKARKRRLLWVAFSFLILVAGAEGLAPRSARRFAHYVDVADKAGLTAKTIIGEENVKRFILESTGGGVAVFDYDNDNWPDIFFTNGSRVGGFPPGQEPTNHLYRNRADGTFPRRHPQGWYASQRLGPGSLRRRLQPRRLSGPVRDLLRGQRPVP